MVLAKVAYARVCRFQKRTKYIGLDIRGADFVIEGNIKEPIRNKGPSKLNDR
jgi:hypothetical protein